MNRSGVKKIDLSIIREIGYVRLVVFLIIGFVVAWFTFSLTVSGITRVNNPDVALSFYPSESTALAERADRLLLKNLQSPPPLVRQLALTSLRGQAINPKALRILGFYADIKGNYAVAEHFMRSSARQSRREVGAQLWLIEAAARKNDDRMALAHYDIALRAKTDLQALLFPRLLAAIDDRQIRIALRPFIRKDNNWAASFLVYANTNSKNLPALVDLVLETGVFSTDWSASNQKVDLLQRLVNDKFYSDVSHLYLKMPDAKASRLISPSFDPSDSDGRYGPVGWQLVERPDAGGSFSEHGDFGITTLSAFANSGTTETIGSRLLFLAPGRYAFSAKLSELQLAEHGFLRWRLRCLEDQYSQPVWSIDSITKLTKASIAIPSNCKIQLLELIVSGGQGQTGLEATIASISIGELYR